MLEINWPLDSFLEWYEIYNSLSLASLWLENNISTKNIGIRIITLPFLCTKYTAVQWSFGHYKVTLLSTSIFIFRGLIKIFLNSYPLEDQNSLRSHGYISCPVLGKLVCQPSLSKTSGSRMQFWDLQDKIAWFAAAAVLHRNSYLSLSPPLCGIPLCISLADQLIMTNSTSLAQNETQNMK